MEELINYMTRFVPNFVEQIRGASVEEIATLEKLVGFELPSIYRAFLARMGHDSGELFLSYDTTTRISDIIDYYQQDVLTGRATLPANTLLIAYAEEPPAEDVILQLVSDAAPKVYMAVDGYPTFLLADSLEKLLFRYVFIEHELRLFSYSSLYYNGSPVNKLNLASQVAQELGFQIEWFSDSIEVCGKTEIAAVHFNQFKEHALAMRLAAQEPAELERLGAIFWERLEFIERQ